MADNERVILSAGWPTAVAAGTDDTLYLCNPHPYAIELKTVYFVPHNTSAANATNYTTLALKKGSTAVITAVTTETVALTAGTVAAKTVLGVGGSLVLATGEVLAFSKTDSGTGVAVSMDVVCSFEPVRG